MTTTYQTHSQSETEALGKTVAAALQAGDVVALFGQLGAGKTAFVRGVLHGLGVEQPVTSPTFAIVNEYRGGSAPAAHFDMYRVVTEADLYSTGYYDYLDGTWLVLMEWSEHIPWALEPDMIRVTIEGSGDDTRTITIER